MRILIIGSSCAGKSAFARALGSQTGLRAIELDALYWGPQWMPRGLLNSAFVTVLWRALRRTIRRTITREELWNGNRESLRRSFFSRESIFWWIITTHRRRREEFARLRARNEYPNLTWIEFLHPADAVAYLRTHSGSASARRQEA